MKISKSTITNHILPIIVYTVLLGTLIASLYSSRSHLKILLRGVDTEGNVLLLHHTKKDDSEIIYPIVSFFHDDQLVTGEGIAPVSKDQYKVDQEVSVRYDPSYTNLVVVDSDYDMRDTTLLVVLIAILLVIYAIFRHILIKKLSKHSLDTKEKKKEDL